MAPHTNSGDLKYELNVLEHDSDYYSHSKVRVIRNSKRRRVPVKALINIILMVIVSAVAIAVIVASVAKAI